MPEFLSPSTGLRVRAVLFDTFGTVVDWQSGIAEVVQRFAQRHQIAVQPTDFARDWRKRYQPAMAEVRSGRAGASSRWLSCIAKTSRPHCESSASLSKRFPTKT